MAEAKLNEYVCETSCFRDGTLFHPGDILESPYKTAPKHFQGYDPKKDPESVTKPSPKKEPEKAPELDM
jgi:hypothetical protein